MSLALYRKYRSKSFDDVVGQDHITKTLQKSIDNDTFSHAYLLTGLRGVGKTSVARIFAAYVNGINYEETENNPDIIEIDAASNRKIDEIRDLREKVNIAPSNLKYKVYIIDEVHMLTREEFNALLKTLEEPPQHCILVLATTDYHKLPGTIISRCIRFSFKAISDDDIVKHLNEISIEEKIKIDQEALQLIAENSSGSLRDALTVLDQSRNIADKIGSKDVELLLGLANKKHIRDLYIAVESKNVRETIGTLENVKNAGASVDQVINQFCNEVRSEIISGKIDLSDSSDLLSEIMRISDYSDKWLAFEICLLKHISKNSDNIKLAPKQASKTPSSSVRQQTDNQINITPKNSEIEPETGEVDLWQNVLNELKKTNSTLYGVARMADAAVDGESLELRLKFNFHKKQLDIKHNKVKILEIINRHDSRITAVNTIFIKENNPDMVEEKYDGKKDVSNISNIFGSAEMLE